MTLEDKAAIEAARAAYTALNDKAKALVTNVAVLEAAEKTYAELVVAAEQEAADKAAAAEVDARIAAIGEVTLEDKAAIEAARAAYEALTEPQKTYVAGLETLVAAEAAYAELTGPEPGVVSLIVTGPASLNITDKEAVYTVSVANASDLATVMVQIEISEDYLTDPVVAYVNGWYQVAQVYKDGVLTVVLANNAGVDGEGDLFTLTLQTTDKDGEASVAVIGAEMAAYDGEGEVFVEFDLTGAAASTTVEKRDIYDVNRDGVVDQLDVTRAQRWYGTNDVLCDVDGSGEVDVTDMILILNHYSDLFR